MKCMRILHFFFGWFEKIIIFKDSRRINNYENIESSKNAYYLGKDGQISMRPSCPGWHFLLICFSTKNRTCLLFTSLVLRAGLVQSKIALGPLWWQNTYYSTFIYRAFICIMYVEGRSVNLRPWVHHNGILFIHPFHSRFYSFQKEVYHCMHACFM